MTRLFQLGLAVLGGGITIFCTSASAQPPNKSTRIDPSKVIDGKTAKSPKGTPSTGTTSATYTAVPANKYHWEPAPEGDQQVLFLDGRRLGVYDRKTDTYRKYDADGRLSEPVPLPWKEGEQKKPAPAASPPTVRSTLTSLVGDLHPVYYWSALAGVVPLGFIVIGFFFLMDENENLGDAAWGKHRAKAVAMAVATQQIWKYKAVLAPLGLGLLFFGLVGIGCTKRGMSEEQTLLCAAGLGGSIALALFVFSWQTSQKSVWTFPIRAAVGQPASVLDTVPADGSGTGKVKVMFGAQGQEFPAVTTGPELPAGHEVRVVSVIASRVLEVTGASFQVLSRVGVKKEET